MSIASENQSTDSSLSEPRVETDHVAFWPLPIEDFEDLGETQEVATQLALKLAATTANFGTLWMVEHLKLPHRVVDKILWELKDEKLVEILGQSAPLTYNYRITSAGIDLANRLMDLCGYLGPMPVSLNEYIHSIEVQKSIRRSTSFDDVKRATAELTIDEEILEVASLAYSSNRSLFIFGPAGNGKSTLGRMLHNAARLEIWIPHAISVDNQVIRLFDPQYHHQVKTDSEVQESDRRWLKIEQPFVVSGGELTMVELDLVFDRSANFYEAPPHMKANCGTYFIDDLGRQRIPPVDLLNRWIIPLEQQIDYLSLVNGKKIELPFQMMLIVATNLKTEDVADAAFLRRMGYRIHLDNPDESAFRTIFSAQIRRMNLDVAPDLVDGVVARYLRENRPWRASEARDLLLRCEDVMKFRAANGIVDDSIMDVAWRGYFSSAKISE